MMDDKSITREDALNAINRIWDRCEEIEAHLPEGDPDKTGYKMIADYLTVWKYLSAQPEPKTMLFDSRLKLAKSYKEWAEENHVIDCAESVIYYLDIIGLIQPEIIHCENCEHWKNNHLCECLSRYGTFDTPKDFYCGYGKAK